MSTCALIWSLLFCGKKIQCKIVLEKDESPMLPSTESVYAVKC